MRIETLIDETGTPAVNLHLVPTCEDHPNIPEDSAAPDHIEFLTECMIRDVRAVAARFGREHVIVENCFAGTPFLNRLSPVEDCGILIRQKICIRRNTGESDGYSTSAAARNCDITG